ncbi:endonuclease III [candidate division KSB1 bacterium]
MSESIDQRRERVRTIIALLRKEYPEAQCSLRFSNALELLVATILSAQCTDARVNMVTPTLFEKYTGPEDYVSVSQEELAEDIRSTGFFNQKSQTIRNCCLELLEKYNGEVPRTMDELTSLLGVGRKTANVLLGNVFDTPGIVVDTHVKRLAERLSLSQQSNPDKIETDLNAVVEQREWIHFSHLLIDHGRKTCQARKPKCGECSIAHLCPSAETPLTK